MTNSDRELAAQFLLAARKRRTPGPRIPAQFRPADTDDGLAIQVRVTELLGQRVGGYKCSLPSTPRPVLLAPIFAPTITHASPCPVLAVGATARTEPEIAFVMARDLPRRATAYTDSEVRDAIGEVRLVLEILGSRYSDPDSATFPEVVADGLANQGLFVGPVLHDPWNRELGALPIVIDSHAGVLATYAGQASGRTPGASAVLARQLPGDRRHAPVRRHDRDHGLVLRGHRCATRHAHHRRVRRSRNAVSDADSCLTLQRGFNGLESAGHRTLSKRLTAGVDRELRIFGDDLQNRRRT